MTPSSVSGFSSAGHLKLNHVHLATHRIVPILTALLLTIHMTATAIFALVYEAPMPSGYVIAAIILFSILAVLYTAGHVYIYCKQLLLKRRGQAAHRGGIAPGAFFLRPPLTPGGQWTFIGKEGPVEADKEPRWPGSRS